MSPEDSEEIDYYTLFFRGTYILKRRRQEYKSRMVAASFSAWQQLRIQLQDPPSWDKYLESVGLAESGAYTKPSKEDLKKEAEQAMANANRTLERLRKNKQR